MKKIYEITEIASLRLLHWPKVLEEIFLGPPLHMGWQAGPEPKLVRDLAEMSLMPVQKVVQKLQVIVRENRDIELSSEDFVDMCKASPRPLIINVDRGESPVSLLGSEQVVDFFAQPFSEICMMLDQAHRAVVCSRDSARAYSAAMELRHLGYRNINCLSTSLEDLTASALDDFK
jgi:hypothetical protein